MSLNYQMVLIQCQIFKIILSTSLKSRKLYQSPVQVFINRINIRSVFKIKDGYKLELQTPETIKLFGSTKKIERQNKKRRKCAKDQSI